MIRRPPCSTRTATLCPDSTLFRFVQSIQPGVDNRDSVMKTLGRPSFEAEFDKNAWYYVSRETRQFGFNRPKPREQMVLVVQFDPKGTVSNVARHGMEDVVDIAMVRDKTPTLGRHTGFFQAR